MNILEFLIYLFPDVHADENATDENPDELDDVEIAQRSNEKEKRKDEGDSDHVEPKEEK